MGRLYSSTYYALRDTRTPLRYAIVRVCLTTGLGYLCALPLPRIIGIDPRWGVGGLTASAGVAGWVEFFLLRRSLNRRIGQTGLLPSLLVKLWCSALVAGVAGWALRTLTSARHPVVAAEIVLIPYGLAYFGMAILLRVDEMRLVLAKIRSALS